MVAADAEAAALLKLLGLLNPARCNPSAPISPIPLPTAPATVTTPFNVLLRNSRPLPSPFGAQVCSHASERSAADSNESKAGLRLVVNDDERRWFSAAGWGGWRVPKRLTDEPFGVAVKEE